MSDLVEHELGCHLNQRHEDYLQDHGLGYSSIKELFLSPSEWWNSSPHNPLRAVVDDDENKLAFKRGAALHTHVLDGPRLYDRVYGTMPTRYSHPDALDTVEELKEACAIYGLDDRGLKSSLVQRLVTARKKDKRMAGVEILLDLQDQFSRTGKKAIAQSDDFRIRMLYRMMMRSPEELKLPDGDHITLKSALEKSLTEVSIYWVDENGIRQRARFDLLKPNFTGDLKSITKWKKTNFKQALLEEVIFRGYMIQDAHYHEARKELRKAVAEGRVFGGNKTQRRLLERIARSDYWAWVFIFAKMDGAPQVKGIVVRPDSGQFKKAQQQREEALANFLFYREFHGGLDVPWFDPEVVWEPAEDEWPMFSVLGQ
jgi:hypothetical protein